MEEVSETEVKMNGEIKTTEKKKQTISRSKQLWPISYSCTEHQRSVTRTICLEHPIAIVTDTYSKIVLWCKV